MRPAVFLDRDGTMIHDVGYLSRQEDLRWYPWTIDAIRLLNRAGFSVCVVTNQGAIGLGYTTPVFVEAFHLGLDQTITAGGGRVDGWYYCPHHPRAVTNALRQPCDCRKPRPGLVRRAARELDLDLTRSYVVGDKASDVGLAQQSGAQSVLVRTGHGAFESTADGARQALPGHVADHLMEATSWILERSAATAG